MAKSKFYPPKFNEGQFHCPHCGVYAKQFWAHIRATNLHFSDFVIRNNTPFDEALSVEWRISRCEHCGNYMFWLNQDIVYPDKISVDDPNDDLNPDIKRDYKEAAEILHKSPRGSAALLRLSLQKLLKQLGEEGNNINEDIKKLIANGLNPTIQKALDYVRITGNNAVHPGQIDLSDNKDIALKLFEVINFIAEKTISEPKEVNRLFDSLPEDEKEKIKKRDNQN
ncbi:MAG TPA: DUF4145 domain-containing protein [Patescibacteria group bacterium]|nr:DUF4145 domain-containing protein [Patescibacteria group bacterium]